MKAIVFKAVLLLAIVLALPMLIPGPDGKPIMSPKDWLPTDLMASVRRTGSALGDIAEGGGSNTVYSWVDEHGVQHYSDAPTNAAVENAKQLPLPDSANLIPPPETTAFSDAVKARRTGSANSPQLRDLEALSSGDYSKAPELIKNLPELLEQAQKARQGRQNIE
jgi:hypothetical protein